MIKEKYGIDVYDMGSLVQEAIDFADANPKPLHRDVTPKEEIKPSDAPSLGDGLSGVLSGSLKKNDSKETMEQEDSAVSEDEADEFNAPEDFRQVGLEIKEMLLEGMEISDELYVKMFISKLRLTYEYKDPKSKQKELK